MNWDKFKNQCSDNLAEGKCIKDLKQFMETFISIAKKYIPKGSVQKNIMNLGSMMSVRKLWGSEVLRNFNSQPSTSNLLQFKQLQVKAWKIMKENKKESCKKYVAELILPQKQNLYGI